MSTSKKRQIDPELLMLGKRIRAAREEMKLTARELARRSGVSFQQISRIEKGTIETGVSTLSRISKSLGRFSSNLIPLPYVVEEQVEQLWNTHRMMERFTGNYDLEAKRVVLQAEGLWNPVSSANQAELDQLGLMGFLPNREAENQVIAELSSSTKIVKLLFITGATTLADAAVKRLEELLVLGNTTMEFLGMDEQSPFVDLRTWENHMHSSGGVKGRMTDARDIIVNLQRRARARGAKSVGELRTYDLPAIHRLLFVDDRVYSSFYPPDHSGADVIVRIYQADTAEQSEFWPLLKEYWWYWHHRDAQTKKGLAKSYAALRAQTEIIKGLARQRLEGT